MLGPSYVPIFLLVLLSLPQANPFLLFPPPAAFACSPRRLHCLPQTADEAAILKSASLADLKSIAKKMDVSTTGTKLALLRRIKDNEEAAARVLYAEENPDEKLEGDAEPEPKATSKVYYSSDAQNDMTAPMSSAAEEYTRRERGMSVNPPNEMKKHIDKCASVIEAIYPETPHAPFEPSAVDINLLIASIPSLVYANGEALATAIREAEITAVGKDGMFADEVSKGGGWYRQLMAVSNFLKKYSSLESDKLHRGITSRLIAAATEGNLEETLGYVVREGGLTEGFIDNLSAAVKAAKQKSPGGSSVVTVLTLLLDRVKAEALYGVDDADSDDFYNTNMKVLAKALQIENAEKRDEYVMNAIGNKYERVEGMEQLLRDAKEYYDGKGSLIPGGSVLRDGTVLKDMIKTVTALKNQMIRKP
jgi:hypothetical protein